MSSDKAAECSFCSSHICGGTDWIVLNRYALGSGGRFVMSEGRDADNNYSWCLAEDVKTEDDMPTGHAFCSTTCLAQFIEYRFIDVAASSKR